MADRRRPVVVTAVLPSYRQRFLELVHRAIDVDVLAGSEHCDPSVRTGVDPDLYRPVHNAFLLGRRLFLQHGAHIAGIRASVTVVDLNPRSLTSWAILVVRRGLHRRTLVWGHLHPRAGAGSATEPFRQLMVRLADGVITYTWSEQVEASAASGKPSWAATNALYTRAELVSHDLVEDRHDLVYVGRLESTKKLDLLLKGFARAAHDGFVPPDARLVLIGEGTAAAALPDAARLLGVGDRVELVGPVYEFDELSKRYATAAAGVCAGYGGLQITQSLGFGVPIVLPRDDPHAPEIELAEDYCTYWFDSDSVVSLSQALHRVFDLPLSPALIERARATVMERYTSEAMAQGFLAAMAGQSL